MDIWAKLAVPCQASGAAGTVRARVAEGWEGPVNGSLKRNMWMGPLKQMPHLSSLRGSPCEAGGGWMHLLRNPVKVATCLRGSQKVQ